MRRIRWARELTAASWVTRTSVCRCSRFRRTRRSMICTEVSESKFPVGSSAQTIAGSFTRARAIATRCCCPALNCAGLWSAHPSSSTAVMSASALRRASLAGTLATRRGSSTFSTAVNTGSRLYVWKTKPIRRERYRVFALSSIEASETPSMRTSPEVRSSRPEKQFRRVVLPHPDGPMIATISPRGITRFTPRSAWTLTAPELYTLWASTPRIIGSTSMRIVSMSRGIFRVSLRLSLGARDEQVQRPRVLDACGGGKRPQANCELLVECLAAFDGHLAELSLIPSVRTRDDDEFRHAREPDRERLRRRIPLLETRDAERLEDRARVSEGLRLRIRPDEPHRLPHQAEILRRRSRPMLLEQFPQRGEGWVRIRRPLAEDEPSGGFQDAVDLLEHAVVSERRDPEVADRGVEELAMVDDVPRVEHLEPDVPDARVPGPVRGDGDRAVRQVDRDDALREDARRDLAREKPGSRADVEGQFARFRVYEPDDFLGDRLEPRGHVLVVRLRHPAVLVDPHEGRLVRVHRSGAKKPRAIKASRRKGLCRSRRLRLRGRAGPPFQGGTGLHHPGVRRPLLSGKRSEGRRARPQRRRRLGPRREIVCGRARAATRPGGRDAGREGREGPQGCEEAREGARHRPSDHRHCADRELPGKPAPRVPGRPGRPREPSGPRPDDRPVLHREHGGTHRHGHGEQERTPMRIHDQIRGRRLGFSPDWGLVQDAGPRDGPLSRPAAGDRREGAKRRSVARPNGRRGARDIVRRARPNPPRDRASIGSGGDCPKGGRAARPRRVRSEARRVERPQAENAANP